MNALAAFRATQARHSHSDRVLNLADVLELNSGVKQTTGVTSERLFFGMPLSRAVGSGFKITARGYFDATESPFAVQTAKMIWDLLASIQSKHPDPRPDGPRLLDLFAGTGQMTWAFVRRGFQVHSTELDPIRALVAQHNVKFSGLTSRSSLISTNGSTLLRRLAATRQRFDAVYLDPPWAGRYDYDLSRPFRLEHMAPSGLDLLKQALHLSDLVALKCPQNTCVAQLREVCRDLDLSGRFELQNRAHLPPELSQATAYFVKRPRICRSSSPLGLTIGTVTLSEAGLS